MRTAGIEVLNSSSSSNMRQHPTSCLKGLSKAKLLMNYPQDGPSMVDWWWFAGWKPARTSVLLDSNSFVQSRKQVDLYTL